MNAAPSTGLQGSTLLSVKGINHAFSRACPCHTPRVPELYSQRVFIDNLTGDSSLKHLREKKISIVNIIIHTNRMDNEYKP